MKGTNGKGCCCWGLNINKGFTKEIFPHLFTKVKLIFVHFFESKLQHNLMNQELFVKHKTPTLQQSTL